MVEFEKAAAPGFGSRGLLGPCRGEAESAGTGSWPLASQLGPVSTANVSRPVRNRKVVDYYSFRNLMMLMKIMEEIWTLNSVIFQKS